MIEFWRQTVGILLDLVRVPELILGQLGRDLDVRGAVNAASVADPLIPT
jgi:hypothetical protein